MAIVVCLQPLMPSPPMALGRTEINGVKGEDWQLLLARLTRRNQFTKIVGIQLINIQSGRTPELLFKNRAGQSGRVSMAGLISARNLTFSPGLTSKWRIFLKDGGWICGQKITSHGQNFHLETSFGLVTVPLNDAIGLGKSSRGLHTHRAAAHDRVYFPSGGMIKGTFTAAGARGVEMHSALGTEWTPWSRIEKLVLGGLPTRNKGGTKFAVTLFNGSMLKATSIQLVNGLLGIHTITGVELKVPISTVGEIDMIGGKVTWLASVQPDTYRQTPLFGQPWPLQRNRNAVGGPLHVDGITYSHGLGMEAPCSVTYQLGGQYRYFLFAVQMDDSAKATGRGYISIRIDGHHVYTSKVLNAGMPVHFVRLPLHGAGTLSISARSASYLATRCRIDLLDAALLRK